MTNLEIINPVTFTRDLTAKCTVKLGNIECELKLYNSGKTIEDMTIEKPTELITIESAGLEIDYSNITKAYADRFDQAEKDIIAKRVSDSLKNYDNAWWQIQDMPVIDGVTYNVENREAFIERATKSNYEQNPRSIEVCYRDFSVSVTRERSRGRTKYFMSCVLNNYRNIGYASFENIVKKIVKSSDEKVATQQEAEAAKIRKEESNNKTLNEYKELFGNVTSKTEWKRGYSPRDRGYNVTNFYIVVGDKKYRITKSHDGSFTFGSFSGLTSNAVLAIVDIIE